MMSNLDSEDISKDDVPIKDKITVFMFVILPLIVMFVFFLFGVKFSIFMDDKLGDPLNKNMEQEQSDVKTSMDEMVIYIDTERSDIV